MQPGIRGWFHALALTAGLVSLAGTVACHRSPSQRTDAPAGAFAELQQTTSVARPFVPRLAGFPYAPVLSPTRGPASDSAADVRLAAARLEKHLEVSRTSVTLVEFAAGALLTGRTAAAIAALEEASVLDPRDARVLNDLSAAYLVRATANTLQPSADYVRALDAALKAARLAPALQEAWFNRALAMEAILPTTAVQRAWMDYLHADGITPWAEEARRRAMTSGVGAPVSPAPVSEAAMADLAALVRTQPQRAREVLMEEIIPAWGRALIDGRKRQADDGLARAAVIADVLGAVTGDPFARHTVARMRNADTARATARAFIEYAEGRRAYTAERREFARQRFARLHSSLAPADPLRSWAGIQLATLAIDRRDIEKARALLVEPSRLAEAAGYTAAYARTRWLAGLIDHQSNRVDAALESYDSATTLFSRLGEHENELAVYTVAADTLRLRGERRRSWIFVLRVLARTPELSNPLRRYLAFFNAALFAADEQWLHAALAFQDHAVEEARSVPSKGPLIEALSTKGRLLFLLQDHAGAELALREADRALSAFGPDAYASAMIDATRGTGAVEREPAAAERYLSRALEFFNRAEPAAVPGLHLLRGRTRLRMGDVHGAEADFASGITDVERRRVAIRNAELRRSYLDDSADLFTEMVALQLTHRGDSDRAFDYMERGRARSLLDTSTAPVLSARHIQARLPPGLTLVEFKSLPNMLACWIVSSEGRDFVDLSRAAAEIEQSAGRLRQQLETGGVDAIAREAQHLYALVVSPIKRSLAEAKTLVVVGDGALARVPFQVLRSPGGRYLIEEYAIATMPSAAAFFAAQRTTTDRAGISRALLISDPSSDPVAFPGLPALPGAQAEVRAIAPLYPNSRTLVAAAATKSAFLAELPRADVVHFAGHAVENRDDPRMSALVLAPDRQHYDSGALRAGDIAALRLPQARLVVLAACDTADGPVTRSEGVHSLARPFLEAGVPNVIATLWKVDDTLASELFRRFHRHFIASGDPTSALRAAQLDMLHGQDAALASPRAWSSAISIGAAGAHHHSTVQPSGRATK